MCINLTDSNFTKFCLDISCTGPVKPLFMKSLTILVFETLAGLALETKFLWLQSCVVYFDQSWEFCSHENTFSEVKSCLQIQRGRKIPLSSFWVQTWMANYAITFLLFLSFSAFLYIYVIKADFNQSSAGWNIQPMYK